MDKYLLEILKDSNTIIIPGLGALTITNKETGETMFMPYLQHDDGKLATFIAQNDGIDEVDAKNMVAKYVREIKAELDKGEPYSMFQLGTFQKKDDGDIEFEYWSKSSEKKDESSAPVAAPIIEEQAETIDESKVDDTKVIEPKEVEEPEAISEPEPESVVIPETVVEVEPEIVSEPEKVDLSEDEIEIRETIVETISAAPKVEEVANEKTILKPEVASTVETVAEKKPEEKQKKKRGAGFWITMIVIALIVIAGGAYVGSNYDELKQNISFLADKDDDSEKSAKEDDSNEMEEDENGDASNEDNEFEESSEDGEEGFTDETESIDETNEIESQASQEVEEPEVTTPEAGSVSSSSGGPYKVIAGAFSSEENAKRLASEFKSKGMNSEVFMQSGLHTVSIQSYPTSEAAKADLSRLKSMAPKAWIYFQR